MADSLISSFKVVEENFSISIPPEEYAYIIELLLESQNLSVSS
jgi:transcriptional regulatory protein LevR